MSERANVLVIDDDPTSAERLKEAVERFHHRARVALTWTEAIRVFSSEHIDIVLMDAVMPTVDGYSSPRSFVTAANRTSPSSSLPPSTT